MIKMTTVFQKFLTLTLFTLFISMSITQVEANELAYQEEASEIIHNSIQTEPKKSFLRKLYKELLFSPVWMRNKSLSPAAKELFSYIQNDATLNTNGKLHKDSTLLQRMAQTVYEENRNTYAKVSVEFKISQLYKAYMDYTYFGSINWGAFNARISNLKVNDVSTEWVLHRPDVNPVKILSNVVFWFKWQEGFDLRRNRRGVRYNKRKS